MKAVIASARSKVALVGLRSLVCNDPFDPCHYFLEGISADLGQFPNKSAALSRRMCFATIFPIAASTSGLLFIDGDIIRVVRRRRAAFFCGNFLCTTMCAQKACFGRVFAS